MSSILFGRLRRLERHHGTCRTCGGKGRLVIEETHPEMSALHSHGPTREWNKEGCPECGRKQLLVIRFVKETAIRR